MSDIVRFESFDDGRRCARVEASPCRSSSGTTGAGKGSTSDIVRFGSFEVDLDSGQLRKCGSRIRLPEQSFRVLACLLEYRGRVVSRENLHRRLWGDDVFVDFDNNLNTAVARLREVLGDSVEHPRFIETAPKRGYRFIREVYPLPPTAETATPRARLVVLPFAHRDGDCAGEYVSDAMTDDLITALASLARENLGIIARTTAMHYKGCHKDVACIARELDVDYLVEGAVRRSGNRIAVNVRLIQAIDQTHLYASTCNVDMRDVSALQHRIARAIASCIPCVWGPTAAGSSHAGGSRTAGKAS